MDPAPPTRPAEPPRSAWQRVKRVVNVVFVVALLASIFPVLYLTARPALTEPGKTHLRYMYWGGPEQLAQERDVYAAFRAAHPDIDVELLGMNARYWEKMAAMLSSGQGPDVFLIAPGNIPSLADRDQPLLADIADLVVRDRESMAFDDILPQAVRGFYCNGRLFGLPRDYKTTGIGYNATLLAEAGLADPNDLAARGQWTWETFVEYLRALDREFVIDGRPRHVFGLYQDPFSEGYWHNILLQAGGGIFGDDGRELIIGRPESVRGLQFLYDLAWTWGLAKPLTNEMGVANPWSAQETAVLGLRGWHTSRYIRETYDRDRKRFRFAWDVAPWPLGPWQAGRPEPVTNAAGRPVGYRISSGRVVLPRAVHFEDGPDGRPGYRLRGCTATGIGYAMSANTRHREAAWTLQKFLVSPTAQKIRARFLDRAISDVPIPGPNMPSRILLKEFYERMARDNAVRPTFTGCLADKNRQPLWPRVDVWIDARDYGRPSIGALGQQEVMRELDRQVQRMLTDRDVTPQVVVAETERRAEQIYRRLREEPFSNSFKDPSLIRPPVDDPLGLAP